MRKSSTLVFWLTITAITILGLWIYLSMEYASHTLPPLYFAGSAPTNPTIEGTLWLDLYIRRNMSVPLTYIANWSNLPPLVLQNKQNSTLLILIIGPEKPYTREEANAILSLLNRHSRVVVVLASERATANSLLGYLKAPILIDSKPLKLNRTGEEAYLVPLELRVSNKTFRLIGNLATPIVIYNRSLVNTSNGWTLYLRGVAILGREGIGVSVEAVKRLGENELVLYVIGDSFPFTNLAYFVDKQLGRRIYTSYVRELLDFYARRDTIIAFDVSKYYTLGELLSAPNMVNRYTVSLDREAALLASLLHPSTWIPLLDPFLNATTARVQAALESNPFTVGAALFAAIALGIYIVFDRVSIPFTLSSAARENHVEGTDPMQELGFMRRTATTILQKSLEEKSRG